MARCPRDRANMAEVCIEDVKAAAKLSDEQLENLAVDEVLGLALTEITGKLLRIYAFSRLHFTQRAALLSSFLRCFLCRGGAQQHAVQGLRERFGLEPSAGLLSIPAHAG